MAQLVDQRDFQPDLCFGKTELVDGPSYVLADDLNSNIDDNPGTAPRCLIHGIPNVWIYSLGDNRWECPICKQTNL